MGGYGTPIGETKSYRVYLYVNCSSEYHKFVFKVERKKDNQDIDYESWCSGEHNPDIEKFNEELQKDYTIFWIKDKGLREKDNIKLKEQIASLREKVDNIRGLL